jgi:MGT family glycosyltransferase
VSRIFYYGVPATGHINPLLPVLAELVKRGQQIITYNSEEHRAKFESTGVTFRAYPTIPEIEALMKNAGTGGFPGNALRLLHITQKLLPMVLADLQNECPDVVMYDSLATWGRAGAEKLGFKTLSFLTTFVLTPPMAVKLLPFRATFNTVIRALPFLPHITRVKNSLRRAFGVSPQSVANPLANTGQLNIVFTVRGLQPKAALFGDDYVFVGAAIAERPEQLDFTLAPHHPVVYISLGTINNQNIEFYGQCFAAFRDYPAQFVLSAGKQTDIKALGDIPPNFIVRNYVAQLELLKQTTVYISHSGMNSVHESLYYGVPLVLVPQQAEQLMVALQVQSVGAGEAIGTAPPFGKTTAAELRAALERVLGNHARYQQAAQNLGDQIKAAGGISRAVDEIIRFTATQT